MSANEETSARAEPAATSGDIALEAKVEKYEARLETLLLVGGLIFIVGVVAGLFLALHAKVAPCENGHYFPPGTTDFNCYAHPHAIVGCTLIGASVFGGLVLAVTGLTARLLTSELVLRRRPPTTAVTSAKNIGTMAQI
jgi:hypothetical protein